jgi:hypothetical protein
VVIIKPIVYTLVSLALLAYAVWWALKGAAQGEKYACLTTCVALVALLAVFSVGME